MLPIIQADENRLKQVLINLIDNSLKFTDAPGSITVEACTAPGHVIVSVADTGAGISEGNLANVLQKFYKGDPHATGSGLGLAISDQIVKLHKGELQIASTEGQGTKVQIRLPI
jgi:signal transduction histidine kinase